MISWKQLAENPFGFVDSISIRIKNHELNFLKDDVGLRREAFWVAAVCLTLWVFLGFDSTPLQFLHVIYEGIPGLIAGQKSLADLVSIYNSFYGKEMHYSAFVIYIFMYYFLSRSWAKIGVKGFKNVAYSFGAVFLSIGVFEWFWILSFGVFQNQPWVYTWQMPQLRILLQNSAFTFTGIMTGLYCWIDSYQVKNKEILGRNWLFKRSWKLWVLAVLSVVAALLWIYYPFGSHQFSVLLDNGQIWRSSPLFPQTLYTIDLNPADQVNAGVWFYFQNDAVHAMNTIVKVIWSLLIYQVFKVKKHV